MRYIVVMSAVMMMQGCFGFGTSEDSMETNIVIECDKCEGLKITSDEEGTSGVDAVTIGPAGGGNQ